MVPDIEFLAAGGNRHPSAADWDPVTGVLAFGANQSVALWHPVQEKNDESVSWRSGIYTLLNGHSSTVNAVRFLRAKEHRVLLTGSADSTIRVWQAVPLLEGQNNGKCHGSYVSAKTLVDHGKSVNAIATVKQGSSPIFASGAADASVKIWRLEALTVDKWGGVTTPVDAVVSLLQTIELTPKFFPLSLAISNLPSSDTLILAVAGTRATVQLFSLDSDDKATLATTLAGHEGWIRSLDFTSQDSLPQNSAKKGELLLASASQDKYVRLWSINKGSDPVKEIDALDDPLTATDPKILSNKAHRFESGGQTFNATFEALLLGHEDWIFSAQWKHCKDGLKLMTASADNSLAIWQLDELSGIWVTTVRLGEINAQKGATTATGSVGGFWIGLWSSSGEEIASLGRTGSWRVWKHDTSEDRWSQVPGVTGHTREVTDVAWSNDGSYLLSTSADQTTRLFGLWSGVNSPAWYEISRPQIHGYDLNCVASLSGSSFVTGADEKLLRVFDEPKTVANLLSDLCGVAARPGRELQDVASIPVLGLSNKAVTAGQNDDESNFEGLNGFAAQEGPSAIRESLFDTSRPPIEDALSKELLWPEVEKLYGHGHEICTVAASHDGTMIATACRASSIDHAVIRLYETTNWRECKPPLTAHSLTVTSLRFSSDDKYLLSAGRDRQCAVFKRQEDSSTAYKLLTSNAKAHSRMILSVSWAPFGYGRVFATASRDKRIKIWELLASDEIVERTALLLESPVTAIDVLPVYLRSGLFVASGDETGLIKIHQILLDKGKENAAVVSNSLSSDISPSKSITAISWRKTSENSENKNLETSYQLAIASEDSSLRIVRVDFKNNEP